MDDQAPSAAADGRFHAEGNFFHPLVLVTGSQSASAASSEKTPLFLVCENPNDFQLVVVQIKANRKSVVFAGPSLTLKNLVKNAPCLKEVCYPLLPLRLPPSLEMFSYPCDDCLPRCLFRP
ncbi:unnamed protein product [Soboliphyme baturini]|uniref:Bardet-Biedl syndrome 1 protein n=1 Tax=Soboliphyme baturini TaxID=241478 RepID=A0A183IU51_9BILA|nr:unnamed protein product [Soboliphyme baturini]